MWLTSMSGEGSDHTVNNIRLSQDYMLYVLEIKELKKDKHSLATFSRHWNWNLRSEQKVAGPVKLKYLQ